MAAVARCGCTKQFDNAPICYVNRPLRRFPHLDPQPTELSAEQKLLARHLKLDLPPQPRLETPDSCLISLGPAY
jgi:hypothetical protein